MTLLLLERRRHIYNATYGVRRAACVRLDKDGERSRQVGHHGDASRLMFDHIFIPMSFDPVALEAPRARLSPRSRFRTFLFFVFSLELWR